MGKSNPFYGKKHTEETKKNWSKKRKGQNVGTDNPFYGKKHTKEAMLKRKITLEKHNISYKGERNPTAKLNELQVRIIKKLLKFNLLTQREMARIFGIAYVTINAIKQNRLWKHI